MGVRPVGSSAVRFIIGRGESMVTSGSGLLPGPRKCWNWPSAKPDVLITITSVQSTASWPRAQKGNGRGVLENLVAHGTRAQCVQIVSEAPPQPIGAGAGTSQTEGQQQGRAKRPSSIR